MVDDLVDEFCTRHGIAESLRKPLEQLVQAAARTADASASNASLPLDTMLRAAEARTESDGTGDGTPSMVGASAAISLLRRGPLTLAVAAESDSNHAKGSLPRYRDMGPIATGGMGEVRRMRDRMLNREVAVKVILPDVLDDEESVVRFIDEAQTTAQLQHPGIVPVHEMGRMSDGRVFFTMKEVKGTTLSTIIRRVHRVSTPQGWGRLRSGWTFRRLVDAFHSTCEAVAYAHARGVVHRDLKPANIMVGEFGEVLVLDWGLAKVLAAPERPVAATHKVVTERSASGRHASLYGVVAGTPAYMPPEQADSGIRDVTPPGDVYSLGAILYQILTGRVPYEGRDWRVVIAAVQAGPPPPPGREPTLASTSTASLGATIYHDPDNPGPPIPGELRQICLKAMARDIDGRYADAGALAEAIGGWLEGSQRRTEALANVAEARRLHPEIEALHEEVVSLQRSAATMLDRLPAHAPVADKRGGWALQDRAQKLARDAAVREVAFVQSLQAALSRSSDLVEAHELLADHYHRLHVDAEARSDTTEAARYERLLAAHDTGRFTAYLQGAGRLSLRTTPTGARAELYAYVEQDRRRVAIPTGTPSQTPLDAKPLAAGSYLVVVRAQGHAPVRYPVRIGRQEHWDGVAPGNDPPLAVPLPLASALREDECYVPPGWFWSGGDPLAIRSLPRRRVWLDGYVLLRDPITHGQYLEFLNGLVAAGDPAAADAHVPRAASPRTGERGRALYERLPDGRYGFPDGETAWTAAHPVVRVDWHDAVAYARWRGGRDGCRWRLPLELEWEKAARGVDGRVFPWGNHFDPTWCRCRTSEEGPPATSSVHAYPVDESPYGVRHMGGNVSEWCQDGYSESGPDVVGGRTAQAAAVHDDPDHVPRVTRGGFFSGGEAVARSTYRYMFDAHSRLATLGFRLARRL